MLQEYAKAVFLFYWNMSLQIRVVFYWQTLFGAFCCFMILGVRIPCLLWPRWSGWFMCLINIRIRSALLCRETKLDKKSVLFTSSRLFIEVFCQTSSRLACTTASFCQNVLASLHAFFSPFATEMKPEKDIQYKSMLYYTTTIYTIRIKPHQGLHWGTWLRFWVKFWIYAIWSKWILFWLFEDFTRVQQLCWQLISNAPTSKFTVADWNRGVWAIEHLQAEGPTGQSGPSILEGLEGNSMYPQKMLFPCLRNHRIIDTKTLICDMSCSIMMYHDVSCPVWWVGLRISRRNVPANRVWGSRHGAKITGAMRKVLQDLWSSICWT